MPTTRIHRPEAKLSPTVLRRQLDQLERRLRETDARITARLRSLARTSVHQREGQSNCRFGDCGGWDLGAVQAREAG